MNFGIYVAMVTVNTVQMYALTRDRKAVNIMRKVMTIKNKLLSILNDMGRVAFNINEKADYLIEHDVVPIKKGKWYRHDKKIHGDTCYHCSECERIALTDCGMVWELTPYCPFCGAKMDGKSGADNG